MLSRTPIWLSQLGQRERGATIEMPRGTRCATTLMKLPATKPPRKANEAAAAIITSIGAAWTPLEGRGGATRTPPLKRKGASPKARPWTIRLGPCRAERNLGYQVLPV
jgi:hypothetical protein